MKRVVVIKCPICTLEFNPKETNTNICTNCIISEANLDNCYK